MPRLTKAEKPYKYRLLLWSAMLLWLIIIAISLTWNYYRVKSSIFELARIQAQSHFDKDILYRRWNVLSGGIYVEPNKKTPPNPYLSAINDRDLLTTSGKHLTLINPAYMTRQAHELGAMTGGIQGHITSLKPIRAENAPDSWEQTALLAFSQGAEEKVELVEKDNATFLRYMRPLLTEQSCLKCHQMQGYRVGDIRGGISVSVPFGPFTAIINHQRNGLLFGHGIIGLLGLLGLWGGGKRLYRSRIQLLASLQETRRLAERYQLLLTCLGEGVYGTDQEGTCIFINPAALLMLGYQEEEVIGKNPHLLFHAHTRTGETNASGNCPISRTLQDGLPRETEDTFICRDGQVLPVSLLVTPMREPNGNDLEGLIVSFHDITEHQQAEEALTRSREELQRAQAVAHVGSWYFDIVTNELRWSEETCRMFNVSPDIPITRETFMIMVHPDDREMVSVAWEAALRGAPYDIEHRTQVQGQMQWVRERAEVKFDQAGLPVASIGTIQDITAYKKALQDLQESEQRFRTLFSDSPDAYFIMEVESAQVSECNRAAEIMLRGDRDRIIGTTPADFSPPVQPDGTPSSEAVTEKIADLLNLKRHQFEWVHRRFDGSDFWVEVSSSLATYEGRKVMFVSWREISDRKQVEFELRASEERFRATINATPVPKVLVDIDEHIEFLNPAFIHTFGYNLNDIGTLENWYTKACPDPKHREQTIHEWRQRITQADGTQIFQPMETQVRCKDGTIRTVQAEATPLRYGKKPLYLITLFDVTQLRSVSNRLKTLLDNASDGIHILDEQGNVVEFSQSFARMLGYRPEEMARLNVEDWEADIPPGEQGAIIHQLIEAPAIFETRHRRKDGSLYDAEINVRGVILDGQAFLYASARDITERKEMEQVLQKTKSHLATVVNSIPDLIWLKDTDGVYLACNPEFQLFFGAPEQEILGKTDYDFVSHDLADFFRQKDREAIAAGQVNINEEEIVYRSDGRRVTLETRKIPFQDGDGNVLGILGIGRDITERKNAEKQLLQTNLQLNSAMKRLELATKAADIGIWQWDLTNDTYSWDQRMCEIYGIVTTTSENAITYDFWQSCCHPDDLNRVEREMAAAVNGVQDFDTVFRILLPEGEVRHIHGAANVGLNETGKPIHMVGMNRDISGIIQAENALREAKEEAEATSRAKGEFIANMSHEIRTPMNAIIGLSGLGLELPDLPPRLRDYLSKIKTSSRALLSIINDILDFSKIEAGKLSLHSTVFDMEEVLQSVADLFSVGADEKGVELVVELAPNVPHRLHCDPLRLGQVLNNLVGNAVKFTDAGEVGIKVNCLNEPRQSGESAVLQFVVSDTGIGIDKEMQKHLFEPFQQADGSITRRFGGTGLGLTISRHLVERMGGELRVDSELGQGSSFSFTLTLPVEAADGTNRIEEKLGELRVLIVDDLDSSRQMLGEVLRAWHCDVTEVSSGPEALECLRTSSAETQKPFDLILLDLAMPGMNGIKVAKRLQEMIVAGELPKISIVMMITGHSRDKMHHELRELQPAAVLTKPVVPSRLFDTIMDARGASSSKSLADDKESLYEGGTPIRGARILLVEDNETNQIVASHILESMGLFVTPARNGREALARLAQEPFEAVLMDLHMPEMDGLEATRRIRAQSRFEDLPIIAMTAAVMERDRAACDAAGMNAHLPKPIDPDDLLAHLLRWIKPRPRPAQDTAGQPPSFASAPVDLGIAGIDSRSALATLGGNLDLFKSLLRPLVGKNTEIFAAIRRNLEQGRLQEAAVELHTLRGTLGNIGAKELSMQTLLLEENLREGIASGMDKALTRLGDALQTLHAGVDNYLCSQGNSTSGVNPGLPTALDHNSLAELMLALKEQNLAALEQFEAIAPVVASHLAADKVQQLCKAMDSLDFAAALAILQQLGQTTCNND